MNMTSFKNLVSIIIPTFKGAHSIDKMFVELMDVFKEHKIEIIIVNDFSPDNTHEKCLKLYDDFPNYLTYIKLSRNVGEHNAVMAGLRHAKGDWVIIMDDDFQNPPKEALKLLNYSLENNFDVIYGDYTNKKHNLFRNLISKINDYSANYILNKPKGLYLSSFKSINNKIVKKITEYEGPSLYIDGLIILLTSNIASFKTQHDERKIGTSGYSFLKLIKLYGNMATNFSTVPIHICSVSGLIISLISSIFAIITIIEKIMNPSIVIGYTSVIIAIIFFSGVQLIFIGLIGEYIGKILKNVNKEPQYLIDIIKLKSEKNIN